MASPKEGSDYGESTPEEHRESGYRLPGSFYVPPTPHAESTPETDAADQKKRDKIDAVKDKPSPAENKAIVPPETKAPPKKSGKKK